MNNEEISWIGRMFECVYGLNQGDVVTVISEPYNISRRGTKAVDCKCLNGSTEQIECEELTSSIYWEERK